MMNFRRLRIRISLVLAAILLSAPSVALAKCASPASFLVPAEGDLPADPSLHLFFPSWSELPKLTIKDEHGHELVHRLVALPASPAFQVLRVKVESGAAASVVVSHETYAGHTKEQTYRIDPSYPGAPRSRVRIQSA